MTIIRNICVTAPKIVTTNITLPETSLRNTRKLLRGKSLKNLLKYISVLGVCEQE